LDNRETILECALRLFAERGYDAVVVQEIVEAAGITKPTLYHYFGSKRGLLDALLQAHFSVLRSRVEIAADYRGDLPLTLSRVVSAFFALARERPAFFRLQLALWFAPPHSEAWQAVAPWHTQQQALLETLFAHAVNDHGNMRGRQRAYAATLLGMIHTYIGLALNSYVELDEPLVQQAVHQFQHGIYS
jgi:TetR/AcrR family transcriptional regulator